MKISYESEELIREIKSDCMIIKIDNDGIIQIPAEILDKLNICSNDVLKIEVDSENDCIVITKE